MMVRIHLGEKGGLGNDLFRYCYAKAFALKNGATLFTTDWPGRKIFTAPLIDPLIDGMPPCGGDVALSGYFQSEEEVGFWRQIGAWKILGGFQPVAMEMMHYLSPINAAHLRRGDYTQADSPFMVIPRESYVEQFKRLGINECFVVWFERDHNGHFRMPDLEDFLSMMNCKLLLRANSSFSWWASELGGPKTYSPSLGPSGEIVWTEGNPPLDLMLKTTP